MKMKKKKVLIVDYQILNEFKFYEIENLKIKDTGNKGPSTYDLTDFYKVAGGKKELELLLLNEPWQYPLFSRFLDNFINDINCKWMTETLKLFSYSCNETIDSIKMIKPDILLLNASGPIRNLPHKIEDIYLKNYEEKREQNFIIEPKICPTVAELSIPSFLQRKGGIVHDRFGFKLGDPRIDKCDPDYTLRYNGGGVVLGKLLHDLGLKFTFTNEYYMFNKRNFIPTIHAYILDLISKEDLCSLAKSEESNTNNVALKRSDSGNIIIWPRKNQLFRYYENSKVSGIKKEIITDLDKVIEIAEEYQMS